MALFGPCCLGWPLIWPRSLAIRRKFLPLSHPLPLPSIQATNHPNPSDESSEWRKRRDWNKRARVEGGEKGKSGADANPTRHIIYHIGEIS